MKDITPQTDVKTSTTDVYVMTSQTIIATRSDKCFAVLFLEKEDEYSQKYFLKTNMNTSRDTRESCDLPEYYCGNTDPSCGLEEDASEPDIETCMGFQTNKRKCSFDDIVQGDESTSSGYESESDEDEDRRSNQRKKRRFDRFRAERTFDVGLPSGLKRHHEEVVTGRPLKKPKSYDIAKESKERLKRAFAADDTEQTEIKRLRIRQNNDLSLPNTNSTAVNASVTLQEVPPLSSPLYTMVIEDIPSAVISQTEVIDSESTESLGLSLSSTSESSLCSDPEISLFSPSDIDIKSDSDTSIQSGSDTNVSCNSDTSLSSNSDTSLSSSSNTSINSDSECSLPWSSDNEPADAWSDDEYPPVSLDDLNNTCPESCVCRSGPSQPPQPIERRGYTPDEPLYKRVLKSRLLRRKNILLRHCCPELCCLDWAKERVYLDDD